MYSSLCLIALKASTIGFLLVKSKACYILMFLARMHGIAPFFDLITNLTEIWTRIKGTFVRETSRGKPIKKLLCAAECADMRRAAQPIKLENTSCRNDDYIIKTIYYYWWLYYYYAWLYDDMYIYFRNKLYSV